MVKKSYCGLSDEAQHRIRQIRMAYPDLMSLKGKARERVLLMQRLYLLPGTELRYREIRMIRTAEESLSM